LAAQVDTFQKRVWATSACRNFNRAPRPQHLGAFSAIPREPNGIDLKVLNMQANVSILLTTTFELKGAKGVALADYRSGDCLYIESRIGNSVKIAAKAGSAIVRAKLNCIQQLGLTDSIEEILISLNNEYHLIRVVKK